MIDLRSDTITKPTPGMLEAMQNAEVGDDVFGDDPTVNTLQDKVSKLFGVEAALFCPSGTMTNQIAMRVNTQPQDEVVCHKHSHVYLYEGGGMMSNSMVSPKLLEGDRGRVDADAILAAINPDDIHFPRTRLVVLENTMNKGGGSTYNPKEIQNIKAVCTTHKLALHLDGARLFNAIVKNNEDPEFYGLHFDTLSICFSKGLGAPVGSVLLGSQEKINHARRVRKVFGGGMRQAGYLAAACIYALDHHVERLGQDHLHAQHLGQMLTDHVNIKRLYPVDTNIVIAELNEGILESDFLKHLENVGILAVGFGKGLVRFVTHLDFTVDHLDQFEQKINQISL